MFGEGATFSKQIHEKYLDGKSKGGSPSKTLPRQKTETLEKQKQDFAHNWDNANKVWASLSR